MNEDACEQEQKHKPIEERLFPTSKLRLFCIREFQHAGTMKSISRIDPDAICVIRGESVKILMVIAKKITEYIDEHRASINQASEAFLERMDMKLTDACAVKEKLVLSPTPFKEFLKELLRKYGAGSERRIGESQTIMLQYALEVNIFAFISRILLFVFSAGRKTLTKNDVEYAIETRKRESNQISDFDPRRYIPKKLKEELKEESRSVSSCSSSSSEKETKCVMKCSPVRKPKKCVKEPVKEHVKEHVKEYPKSSSSHHHDHHNHETICRKCRNICESDSE
jgi:histone H3/H4